MFFTSAVTEDHLSGCVASQGTSAVFQYMKHSFDPKQFESDFLTVVCGDKVKVRSRSSRASSEAVVGAPKSTKSTELSGSQQEVTEYYRRLIAAARAEVAIKHNIPVKATKLVKYCFTVLAKEGIQVTICSEGSFDISEFKNANGMTTDTVKRILASLKAGDLIMSASESWVPVGKRSKKRKRGGLSEATVTEEEESA